MTPTVEAIERAKKRLAPYLAGYPEPMIDARRLRIANGTATERDHDEIQAEDHVLRELKNSLRELATPPPVVERYTDGTTSEDWKARYSAAVTVAIRQATNVDFHSSEAESITLHFPLDDGLDLDFSAIARAAAMVYQRWREKRSKVEVAEALRRYTPEQLLEAARVLDERTSGLSATVAALDERERSR